MHEDDENGFRRRERFVGKWERRFQLPENVSTASCLPVLANDWLQAHCMGCELLAEGLRPVSLPDLVTLFSLQAWSFYFGMLQHLS